MGKLSAQNEWSGFVKAAMAQCIPLNVHWDLTWRCDHKCVHCYLTDRKRDDLSLSEAVTLLDQLVSAGTLSLLISGGDPFLRPDGIDIIKAARARDFDVRINTHGNFIDDTLADTLAEIGVAKVSISVYSAVAEHHDAVTLITGSHGKSIAAARRLVERGVAVNFKTPVMVQNRDSYTTVRALAEEVGASWELDAHIVPDDESDFGLCSVGVHDSERVLAMMHQVADRFDDLPHWTQMPGAESSARTCAAGTANAYISPDGILFPCLNWRDPIGDLRETEFKELWQKSPVVQKQREITRASYLDDCSGCHFHSQCHYCPGISHAEHGAAGQRSAYVCERTHLTMSAFERITLLKESGEALPDPGTPAAAELLEKSTFADRQWASRSLGAARPQHGLVPHLVQIDEPR